MFIRSITVENFKSFREETTFEFCDGVNFLVGDNNGGKSSALEALLFLFNSYSATKWKPETFYSTEPLGPTRVTADVVGDVDALVAREKYKVLRPFVFEENGERRLRLQRSSEDRTVSQGGKTKALTVKSACFWHPDNGQFENPTGIDALPDSIFDFEAIWADAQPGDHIDFANTKTLGRLLDAAFKRFSESERWKALVTAHENAFADDELSFLVETKQLAQQIESIVTQQYGEAAMRFEFKLPESTVFVKQGSLHVKDAGGETPVGGKGTGMQRAIALSIIQLYAKSEALTDPENPTPLVLILDEPETWLHPTAQLRLGDALNTIGTKEQVFIITHSPYLIRKFRSSDHRLLVVGGSTAANRVDSSTTFGLFGVGEPTWGEINHRAFAIYSHDFHNELYGHVQKHVDQQQPNGQPATAKQVDQYLVQTGLTQTKTWKHTNGNQFPITLPGYVRNAIHHPDAVDNAAVTDSELAQATEALVSVVQQIGP